MSSVVFSTLTLVSAPTFDVPSNLNLTPLIPALDTESRLNSLRLPFNLVFLTSTLAGTPSFTVNLTSEPSNTYPS